jgi:N-glycosylase/DNA lyase
LTGAPAPAQAHRVRHLLPVHGPLDLDLTLQCGQAFRWVRESAGAGSGVVGGAFVRARRDGPGGPLILEVAGDDPGPGAWIRYFRLDENPEIHLAGAPGIDELKAIPGFMPLLGLRLLRQDPWETLASFICSAAANILKITRCVEGIATRYGDPLPGAPRHAFPSPAALARARETGLRSLGLGFRAPFLLETARRLAKEPMHWERLRSAPIEEARSLLTDLPGVGTKIADCVLLFGLDRLDAYPVDRWIRRATMELSDRPKARDRELEEWARRLGPGRGYLQQLIFHLRRTGGPLPPLSPVPTTATPPRFAAKQRSRA